MEIRQLRGLGGRQRGGGSSKRANLRTRRRASTIKPATIESIVAGRDVEPVVYVRTPASALLARAKPCARDREAGMSTWPRGLRARARARQTERRALARHPSTFRGRPIVPPRDRTPPASGRSGRRATRAERPRVHRPAFCRRDPSARSMVTAPRRPNPARGRTMPHRGARASACASNPQCPGPGYLRPDVARVHPGGSSRPAHRGRDRKDRRAPRQAVTTRARVGSRVVAMCEGRRR